VNNGVAADGRYAQRAPLEARIGEFIARFLPTRSSTRGMPPARVRIELHRIDQAADQARALRRRIHVTVGSSLQNTCEHSRRGVGKHPIQTNTEVNRSVGNLSWERLERATPHMGARLSWRFRP